MAASDADDVTAAQQASNSLRCTAGQTMQLKLIGCAVPACADNTLLQNEDFWSSTGNPDPDSCESLLYRLAPPLCALHSVTVGVYRARYQFGCDPATGSRCPQNTER